MCLTVFDAYRHTLRLWRSQKNKILIKNDFERQLMIRKLKLSKGTCLVEEKNMIEIGITVCRFFVASIPTQFVFDQCYNRHGCSFSFQEVLRVGTPTSHSAMPWQFSKESIAFSEWCQNSNWHLVLTCQEIKVQGRSWTFRYLLNYWSWQKS